MALADSWHLRSRSLQCSVTGREFEADELFYTAIFPDPESEAFERRDFSEEAWLARGEDTEPPFSFWRSVFKPRQVEEKVEITDKHDPETLLKRLVEEDEEHTENVRYILAVMLERKKILVETDAQQTPTGLLRIYEHRKDGDVYIVKDPQIPLSEVDKVQDEVHALLMPKPVVVMEEVVESPEEEPTPEDADEEGEVAKAEETVEEESEAEESEEEDDEDNKDN